MQMAQIKDALRKITQEILDQGKQIEEYCQNMDKLVREQEEIKKLIEEVIAKKK